MSTNVDVPESDTTSAIMESPHEEKEPSMFDLDEVPKIPQCIKLAGYRCTTGNDYKKLTCSDCDRCTVDAKFSVYLRWLQELNLTWKREILLCFAETLQDQHQLSLLDLLRPGLNPVSPATDDIVQMILNEAEEELGGLSLRENCPTDKLDLFVKSVEELINWFATTGDWSQQLFLLRCLNALDFPQLLHFCLGLEDILKAKGQVKQEPVHTKVIHETKVAHGATHAKHPKHRHEKGAVDEQENQPVKDGDELYLPECKANDLANPCFASHTYVDLNGVGIVGVEERNVFCSDFTVVRISRTIGTKPVTATCEKFVAMLSPNEAKINLLNPTTGKLLTPIQTPLNISIQRFAVTKNGCHLFTQTAPKVLNFCNMVNSCWQAVSQLDLDEDEIITYLGATERHLVCGTSKTQIFSWDPESSLILFRWKPGDVLADQGLTQAYPVTGAFFSKHQVACVAAGKDKMFLFSVLNSELLKICSSNSGAATSSPIKNVTCSKYFCLASSGVCVYVWEVFSTDVFPRNKLSHPALVYGVNECENRVITGCKDNKIRVWSLLTGQLMRTISSLPENSHTMLACHVIGLNRIVFSNVTGIYTMAFKHVTWTNEGSMMLSGSAIAGNCMNNHNQALIQGETDQEKEKPAWRKRLVKLLNQPSKTHPQETLGKDSQETRDFKVKTRNEMFVKTPNMHALELDHALILGQPGAYTDLTRQAQLGIKLPIAADSPLLRDAADSPTLTRKLKAQMNILGYHKPYGSQN